MKINEEINNIIAEETFYNVATDKIELIVDNTAIEFAQWLKENWLVTKGSYTRLDDSRKILWITADVYEVFKQENNL